MTYKEVKVNETTEEVQEIQKDRKQVFKVLDLLEALLSDELSSYLTTDTVAQLEKEENIQSTILGDLSLRQNKIDTH